jgi:CDP-4-dehydro-6-deoxyglucose reductase
VRVALANSTGEFQVAAEETILDAALDAGFNLPHSCRGGNCGACRARLIAGRVEYPNGEPLGLSREEVEQGFVLLCQAHATSDVTMDLVPQRTVDDIVVKRLPCRIADITRLSHDVMGVYLKLPAAEPFDYKAGQYLDILLPGGRRRSFSIAAPARPGGLIELHVREVQGGAFSAKLFHEDMRGELLSVEGPLGNFFYREPATGAAPALFVGGGTGLAPLLAILREQAERRSQRPMHLYWGVRARRDLYAEAVLAELERGGLPLKYVPVLSEPDAGWSGRIGLVHSAVLEDFASLEAHEVYAAGPPAMIEAMRQELPRQGLDLTALYFDSFDYAVDRQRTSSDTKS